MNDIEQISLKYAKSVYDKDAPAFLALYAPDVVVFDLWERWVYRGRDEWAVMVRGWFDSLGSERVGVTFSPVFCRIDSNVATWGAIVRYAALDAAGAELRSLESRHSWSLARVESVWRIVHEHSSAPIDPGTQKVQLRRGGSA